MKLTITASVHSRWGHRVDGLIHTHAWGVEATVAGDPGCDMVFPADELEAKLLAAVEPWGGKYLTHEDVGEWKGYVPEVWDREPTVEEIARRLWGTLEAQVPGLVEIALVESTEFDRCRTVRYSA
jgi:6-pyruvoyl-tetrahydropterin synthase